MLREVEVDACYVNMHAVVKRHCCPEKQQTYGTAAKPTFHDVKEKVLPADPILMLRSRMPSRLRKLTC